VEGKRELAMRRLRTDCGRETDSLYIAMIYIGRMRSTNEQTNRKISFVVSLARSTLSGMLMASAEEG